MKKNITVTLNQKEIVTQAPALLSDLTGAEKPCGGRGSCGKCKVLARGELSPLSDTEKALLSPDEIARGVRLACLTRALGACEVNSLHAAQKEEILTHGEGEFPQILDPVYANYGVCIDLGTTTLVSRLYDAKGILLATDARLNPQSSFGADVISRVEAALGGSAEELANAIRASLNHSILHLAELSGVDPKKIDAAVITGNTVMLSLLTGTSAEPFSHAPFATERLFDETLTAKSLELTALSDATPVYLPPCISAFVGADVTCAILATALCDTDTALLADVGTNGEMALWHKGTLTVCSTAAGPAFEGVGISMGMRAAAGAVDRVSILNGTPFAQTVKNQPPVGICGSGLVDASAVLLDLELLDESGYLEEDPLVLAPPVCLTQKDIRMLQLAKSAICAGLLTLTRAQNANASEIQSLFIAGGFGAYLNLTSAARIGLLPRSLATKAKAVGNAALEGATILLLSRQTREKATEIARRAVTLSLADSPVFSDLFTAGMLLKPCDG